MPTRRTSRIARVIKEAVSRVLMFELADPRLGFITVTEVDVAPDMKTATVRLSVLGDQTHADLCMKAIHQAHGRVQKAVGDALSTKTVPHLEFKLDESVKKSVEIARLLYLARSEYRQADGETEGSAGEGVADDAGPEQAAGDAAEGDADDDDGDEVDADEDDGDDEADAEERV